MSFRLVGEWPMAARNRRRGKPKPEPKVVERPEGMLTPVERAQLFIKTRDESVLGPVGGGPWRRAIEYVPPKLRPRGSVDPKRHTFRTILAPSEAEQNKRAKLIAEIQKLTGDKSYQGKGESSTRRTSLRWHSITPEGQYASH